MMSYDPPARAPFSPVGTGDITTDTHVRMSVPKFFAVVAGIVGVVAAGLGVFYGVRSSISEIGQRLASHIDNREVHIDPGYQFAHGRPVGQFDLNLERAHTDTRLSELATAIDQLRTALVNRVPDRSQR